MYSLRASDAGMLAREQPTKEKSRDPSGGRLQFAARSMKAATATVGISADMCVGQEWQR